MCDAGGLGVGGFQPRRCAGHNGHFDCDTEFTYTYQYANSEPANTDTYQYGNTEPTNADHGCRDQRGAVD